MSACPCVYIWHETGATPDLEELHSLCQEAQNANFLMLSPPCLPVVRFEMCDEEPCPSRSRESSRNLIELLRLDDALRFPAQPFPRREI